ncbi:MAG: 16S rRNA (uracil(1498)-N(3))-methyltransferase [Prevotella sp.]|nr:16S rRNA (uracil(1498)-N(3))-methyltransferase [Prevotella sp.]MCD8306130.1 16S rRNA (uracil(1498)-N(3))-methyltransferase [Prevotella sp.]
MKEERYFLVPDAADGDELPSSEAQHAFKVLRLRAGDEVVLIDGRGSFHRACLTLVEQRICKYKILSTMPQTKGWKGRLHLAAAPTKNADRIEWMVEKITEIGFDCLTFLNCKYSERRKVRMERINSVVAAAVKQSRKPFVPVVNDIMPFEEFIALPLKGKKFICHCHEEIDRSELPDELAQLAGNEDVTIMIGPEGDFSVNEVKAAVANGFMSVALGTFRLRTETAGVMAVSMYSLANRSKKTI